jgi:hypothetical protein
MKEQNRANVTQLSCMSGTVQIGAARVDSAHVDDFNALCDKYKARFAELPQVAMDGSPQATQNYNQFVRNQRILSAQFMSEARSLLPDDSNQRAAQKNLCQAGDELLRQISEAGGGHAIEVGGGPLRWWQRNQCQ